MSRPLVRALWPAADASHAPVIAASRVALRAMLIAAYFIVLPAATARAQHTWTLESASPGSKGIVGASESFLTSGLPWDADGIGACPPVGADDVQCEFVSDHLTSFPNHAKNAVLAAILDGTAVQTVIYVSDLFADTTASPDIWWVDYEAHFVAVNPNDLDDLRVILQFQHAGITQLTLQLIGSVTGAKVLLKSAPTHFWIETPETGAQWRIRAQLRRTTAGSPAMVWLDNLRVSDGPTQVIFAETFPPIPGDLNGDGCVSQADLGILLANYPCTDGVGNCPGDVDGDGDTDQSDLGLLLGSYGKGCS
jgi:hypothetical protein